MIIDLALKAVSQGSGRCASLALARIHPSASAVHPHRNTRARHRHARQAL